ncbi:phage virion morphogenesis protein [Halodurantibacterium flavum]|uniref:Phage virion morphogenesis protein n=1 Tax=Halodurantibacterium flavum TaxID=1382802 RepID=A0ABW4SAG6_9RHOB
MIAFDINEREVEAALKRIGEALTDMTPVMQDIGELLVFSTKERFVAGVSPDGEPWAPKSQTTLDAYARRRDPEDPRPLFGPSRRLSSEIHYSASADSVEWGSSLIYAAVQQFGAEQGAFGARMGRTQPSEKRPNPQDYFFPIPWGDIPARPFLGLSEDDQAGILDTVSEWIERLAGA